MKLIKSHRSARGRCVTLLTISLAMVIIAPASVMAASPLLPLNYPKTGLIPLGTIFPKCSFSPPSFDRNHIRARFLSCFLRKVVVPAAQNPTDGAAVSAIYERVADAALSEKLRLTPASAMADNPGFVPVRFEEVSYSPYHNKSAPMMVYGYLVSTNGVEEHSKFYSLTFVKRRQFGRLILIDISPSVKMAHAQ